MIRREPIVIAANAASALAHFREPLIRGLAVAGYDVIAAAPPDAVACERLRLMGARFAPVPVDSKGLSPARDLATIVAFHRLFRRERPRAFLGFTIKPNLYGAIAARLDGTPVINNVTGLGTAFMSDGALTRLVERLYRFAFARSRRVFFQNEDDRRLFVQRGLISADVASVLPGSGINPARFAVTAPPDDDVPQFLMIARMLRDKGVGEFVEAAGQLRRDGMRARFAMLGPIDVANRTSIDRATIEKWATSGVVDYLGQADDVRPFIAAATCVVLPSYREGTSRVLLEAGAMARPAVTTDVPGCRDVIEHGVTGLLCAPRDAGALAAAMARMAALPYADREAMGRAARRRIERDYDERIVVNHYLDALERL